MMDPVPPLPDGLAGDSPVTVLWRPGCPYCAMLLRGLARTGLAFDRIDIWEHPEAAAWVRTVAEGDETVPTVRVEARPHAASDTGPGADAWPDAVALVNPSPRAVLDAVARLAPDALPSEADQPRAHLTARTAARLAARFAARLAARFRGRPDPDRGPAALR
jgi:glutaredoxin